MKNHKTLIPLLCFVAACILSVWPVQTAQPPSPPTELWFRFNASTNFNAKFGRLTIQAAYLDFSMTLQCELYSPQTNIVGKIPVYLTGAQMKSIATSPTPLQALKNEVLSNTNLVALLLTEKP